MALEKIRPRVVDETGNYTFHDTNVTGTLVSANANLGNIARANFVSTDHLLYANGVAWSIGTGSVVGTDTQVQFNDGGSGFGAKATFTFTKSTDTLTVTNITANGAGLTSLTGANVTGIVANATYATSAGAATSATTAGTVTTAAQSNITSVGTLTSLAVTGNVTSGNANLGNATLSNYFSGNGYFLTGITGGSIVGKVSAADVAYSVDGSNVVGQVTYAATANAVAAGNVMGQVANALVAGTVYTAAQTNITSLGTLTGLTSTGVVNLIGASNVSLGSNANIKITGGTANYVLQTDGAGNLAWVSAGAALAQSGGINIISNIANIVAGSSLDVSVSYTNPSYPGGVFYLDSSGPVSFTTTDAWSTGGTSKNAYANYIASSVNTANVSITLTLANATFSIQSGDSIVIGATTITGTSLTSLGISGTGGTYTILSSDLAAGVQTTATNSVTTSLTTSRGVKTSTGSTLTNNQPVPFNVTALSGSFGSSSVPYWSLNQTFNWNATATSGATVTSGNVTYSGGASGSLTTVGATSGTSVSLDSSSSYTITSSDYTGSGQYGAGTRVMTATVNGTVNAATKYYPLFYKITNSGSVPTFTVSDSRGTRTYATGDGATTNSTSGDYLWLAIPNYPSNGSSLASHAFKHVFGGFDIVDTPTVTGTQTITSAGQSYNYSIYGFTGFTTASTIITTS